MPRFCASTPEPLAASASTPEPLAVEATAAAAEEDEWEVIGALALRDDPPPTKLEPGEIGFYKGTAVGRKKAHAWMVEFRRACAEASQMAVDISDNDAYPWREYLSNHPRADELVGPGVVKFEGRFTSAMEPNRKKLALPSPLGNHRFDFFVHRVDGSSMRLHPHATRGGPGHWARVGLGTFR
ncbi:MAG: hypothetical protein GY772_06375, partial [bacterium]|nr:hypothetical protein [bacterium]